MDYINSETAAHAIAKIFCEHKYDEILFRARKEWENKYGCKGDPEVLAAKNMLDYYSDIYNHVFAKSVADNYSSLEDERSSVPGQPEI